MTLTRVVSPQQSVIVVAGAPRCGSSLVMRMLYLGGVDVVANLGLRSFEDRRCQQTPIPSSFMAQCPGKAIKVLDPHRCELPRGFRYQLIWLHRNPREQALSMVKFMRAIGMTNAVPALNMERLVSFIRRDATFLRRDLDRAAMAGCVVKRSPICFSGMLELDICDARREVRA